MVDNSKSEAYSDNREQELPFSNPFRATSYHPHPSNSLGKNLEFDPLDNSLFQNSFNAIKETDRSIEDSSSKIEHGVEGDLDLDLGEAGLRRRELAYSDSDDSLSSNDVKKEADHKEITVVEFFSKVLLDLVDAKNLDYVEAEEHRRTLLDLKYFVASCLLIIAPCANEVILSILQQEGAWLLQVTNAMKLCKPKRKDQKLRWVYNSVLKMIVKNKLIVNKKTMSSKYEVILETENVDKTSMISSLVLLSKAPSKKKLVSLFKSLPEVGKNFIDILENHVFLNTFLIKRETKAKQIVIEYLSLKTKFDNQPEKVAARLRTTFKSFPWPLNEITSGCEILLKIARQSVTEASLMNGIGQTVLEPAFQDNSKLSHSTNSQYEKQKNYHRLPEIFRSHPPTTHDEDPDFSFMFLRVECPLIKRPSSQ